MCCIAGGLQPDGLVGPSAVAKQLATVALVSRLRACRGVVCAHRAAHACWQHCCALSVHPL
jgi:hypothetical protein